MLPLLETFQELLFCGTAFHVMVTFFFFGCLQYPEIFIRLRQTLFLETATSHSSKIRAIRWVFRFSNRFLGQKLLDRERLVSWSIVMLENPNVGPKF
jgi:hypothetical protein